MITSEVCYRLAVALLPLTFTALLMVISSSEESAAAPGRGPLVFYVSPDGNDAWSGARPTPRRGRGDGPFATITRAQEAIRTLSADARQDRAITVFLRGGRYRLVEPLVFGPEDSGAVGCPVIYQAYRDEKPVISGGQQITGWTKGERGIWRAHLPDGDRRFHQLFVNGRRATRARTPNEGFFEMDGEISLGQPARFRYRGSDVDPAWAARGDVEVVALQAWAEVRMVLREVDPETKTVTLSGHCAPSNREANARYWVENAPTALDSPGEWYLDRQTGEVCYWPTAGEDPAHAEIVASKLTELVRFAGSPGAGLVSHITFRGLTFADAEWSLPAGGYTDVQAAYDVPAALEGNGTDSVTIEDCTFARLGGYAVAFARGCTNTRIIGSEMTDIGAGGVKIGETAIRQSDEDRTGWSLIADNHIHDIGLVYPAAVGIWIGQSADNVVSHNHIHDTLYSAISVGWTWGYGPSGARGNIIEYNDIHDVGRGMLSDLGGVYTLGIQPGTVIHANLFHDIESYGYGGWGIYLDEGSAEIVVERNLVYKTKSGSFHQHYGRENVVRNNILAFAREGQLIRSRAESHRSFTFERNIVYWRTGVLLGGNWSDAQFRLDSNLYWRTDGEPNLFDGVSLDSWQQRGHDRHSLIADPLFGDPANGDFALSPGSPAARLGIQPLDLTGVGPRTRAQRRAAFALTSRLPKARIVSIPIGDTFGFVALPPQRKTPTPWVWYAPTLNGSYPNASCEWMFRRLLSQGVAVAGIDIGESYGNPHGRALFSRFYQELIRTLGLSPRPALLPQSRGGLMLYNWAAENPEKVACIAGVYTVCDMSSWPGLATAAPAYGMTEDELRAVLPQHNPVDRLAPIAARRVPVLHIHGDQDDVVPLAANSAELVRRYRALGGDAEVLIVPGKGHEECPEFFEEPRVLEFLLRHLQPGRPE